MIIVVVNSKIILISKKEEKKMEEKNLNLESEVEPRSIGERLKDLSVELGFTPTEELQVLEEKIVENAKLFSAKEGKEGFIELIRQFQLTTENISDQFKNRFLYRAGIMIETAWIYYRGNLLENCLDEINNAWLDLSNLSYDSSYKGSEHHEAEPFIKEIENLYLEIEEKSKQKFAE